ncbi:MAG: sulfatase [Acidobacteria bacterium]|nr:sulfatase [Acidobacteriota bacterium]
MTRRGFAAGLGAATLAAAQEPGRAKPNLLLVLSDDHSAPYLGCYGDPVIRTPNFDQFASQGMRFTRAFTAAPQCVPSRTAMLTGRSPVAARMGRFSSPLPPDVVSLPDLLRPAGYYTGIMRRNFHLDGPGNVQPETQRFFDEHGLMTFERRVDFLNRNAPRAQTVPLLSKFLDGKPGEKPFFLWVNFNDPHHPWDDNAIPVKHDPAKIQLPAHLPDLPGVREELGRYFDEIARADAEFQSILDVLEKRGLAENTLIVFMGDNGMAFPHGKGSLYDPGLNVPLMVRWPGRVKPGLVTEELISGEDITPTFLAAAGVEKPKAMSGRSFLGLLTGESYTPRDHVFAARLAHGNSPYSDRASSFDLSRCVRTARYKLIYNCTPHQVYQPVDSAGGPGWTQMQEANRAGTLAPIHHKAYFTSPRPVFELFDLQEDPSELNNIAAREDMAATLRELKRKMAEKMMLDYDFLPLPIQP